MAVPESVLVSLRKFCTTPCPWVLFKNFSLVVVEKPEPGLSLAEQAINIIKVDGPVYPASPHGDFNVIKAKDPKDGWMVTSHSGVLYTYVPLEAVEAENRSNFVVGMHGRGKRHADSQNPEVIHVESKELQQEKK